MTCRRIEARPYATKHAAPPVPAGTGGAFALHLHGLAYTFRYAIDSTKLQTQLHWHPTTPFEHGIEKTVRWYLSHQD